MDASISYAMIALFRFLANVVQKVGVRPKDRGGLQSYRKLNRVIMQIKLFMRLYISAFYIHCLEPLHITRNEPGNDFVFSEKKK